MEFPGLLLTNLPLDGEDENLSLVCKLLTI